jgi:hypothetical protein
MDPSITGRKWMRTSVLQRDRFEGQGCQLLELYITGSTLLRPKQIYFSHFGLRMSLTRR